MTDDALLGFLVALVVAALLTPPVARLARRIGAVDGVKERGLAQQATPLLGGLAIFAVVLVAAALYLPLNQSTRGILIGAAVITLVGAIDDWRELAAGLVLVLSGVSVQDLTLPFVGHVDLGELGDAITLIGLVGLINVVNFSD